MNLKQIYILLGVILLMIAFAFLSKDKGHQSHKHHDHHAHDGHNH